MLIKCPECNREISDKSKQCVHCGYPIQEMINKQFESEVDIDKSSAISQVHIDDKGAFDIQKQIEQKETEKQIYVQAANANKKKSGGCSSFLAIIFVLLILAGIGSCGSGSSSDDRTCAWCNGTGYSGNGAENVTEYVFMKTPCKHCNGTGEY